MGIPIIDQLIGIIVDLMGLDWSEVKEESNLNEDLDIDSLDLTEIALAVEKTFDVLISDSDLKDIETVKDLEQLIIKAAEQNN